MQYKDYYKILGVRRTATEEEIRKAYKQKAREFHPDKNPDPEAQSAFIDITKAYELLSDPERRRAYDNHGITEDTPNFRKQHDYAQYGRFDAFFDDLFTGHGGGHPHRRGFKFSFGGDGGGEHGPKVFHKQSITSKAYWNTVHPNSASQPYLILFYSDWCFTCLRMEPHWVRWVLRKYAYFGKKVRWDPRIIFGGSRGNQVPKMLVCNPEITFACLSHITVIQKDI